jgi:hypothetical protein
MCCPWWQYHRSAAVIKVAYTVDNVFLHEMFHDWGVFLERSLQEYAAPGGSVIKQQ